MLHTANSYCFSEDGHISKQWDLKYNEIKTEYMYLGSQVSNYQPVLSSQLWYYLFHKSSEIFFKNNEASQLKTQPKEKFKKVHATIFHDFLKYLDNIYPCLAYQWIHILCSGRRQHFINIFILTNNSRQIESGFGQITICRINTTY